MKNKIKAVINLIRQGKLRHHINTKYKKIFYIKNKIIRNIQLKDIEYRKMKKKYNYVLEKVESVKKEKSNKVWMCWLQGEENAPDLVKKCIQTARDTLKDRELIIITNENYKEYIDFPKYIIEKFESKIIPYTQFSDLIRIALLAKYGGLWLDATVLCTDVLPKYITESELFVFKEISLERVDKAPVVASSWLISAYSNNEIIVATRDLVYEYWKHEKILNNYFNFHLFFTIATEKFKEQWEKVPTFSNIPPHILQFELLNEYNEERFKQIKEISSVHKLNKAIVNKDKNKYTFYDHIISEKV